MKENEKKISLGKTFDEIDSMDLIMLMFLACTGFFSNKKLEEKDE